MSAVTLTFIIPFVFSNPGITNNNLKQKVQLLKQPINVKPEITKLNALQSVLVDSDQVN